MLLRIWTVAATAAWRTYGRPVNLLWILAVPLFFALPVASLFSHAGTPSVAVVDEDGGPVAGAFLEGLRATPLKVRLIPRQEAEARLASQRDPVVLVLPPDFSASVAAGKPHLELLHGPRYEPGMVVERARAVAAALVTGKPLAELPVTLEPPRAAADPRRYPFLLAVFGVYAMFALSTLMNQAAGLQRERELGTFSRMLALGVSYGEILAGRALALVLVGVIQAAVLLGVTGALGAPWLAAGFPALALSVLATLVAACGWALAVGAITRTPAQVTNLSALVATAAGMLGGAFWPLDVAPAAVQQVGHLSPVYWAMESVREAFVYGGPAAGQVEALAVLLLMGALGAAVGVTGLRRWAS
ncbi:MAG: ABC transporter permease [Clostridia bacterium]|nr:ABC transporter permease [Clostridia bacterium]